MNDLNPLVPLTALAIILTAMWLLFSSQTDACSTKCEGLGMVPNPIWTEYGVQCICTSKAESWGER